MTIWSEFEIKNYCNISAFDEFQPTSNVSFTANDGAAAASATNAPGQPNESESTNEPKPTAGAESANGTEPTIGSKSAASSESANGSKSANVPKP